MRGHGRCLPVARTPRTDHGRIDTPEQMPLILVEPLTAIRKAGAPSEHHRPKVGHVATDLLDEPAARGPFR